MEMETEKKMGRFRPANVWAWWQKKKGWTKWVWLVVAVVGIVLAFVWWIFYHLPDEHPKDDKTGSEGLVGGLEEHFEDVIEKTEKKDEKISAEIEKEREERKEIEAEREKAMEDNKDAHDKIDDADNVSDVVDDWNERRRKPD